MRDGGSDEGSALYACVVWEEGGAGMWEHMCVGVHAWACVCECVYVYGRGSSLSNVE